MWISYSTVLQRKYHLRQIFHRSTSYSPFSAGHHSGCICHDTNGARPSAGTVFFIEKDMQVLMFPRLSIASIPVIRRHYENGQKNIARHRENCYNGWSPSLSDKSTCQIGDISCIFYGIFCISDSTLHKKSRVRDAGYPINIHMVCFVFLFSSVLLFFVFRKFMWYICP